MQGGRRLHYGQDRDEHHDSYIGGSYVDADADADADADSEVDAEADANADADMDVPHRVRTWLEG